MGKMESLKKKKIPKPCIFKGCHLATDSLESNNSWHVLKKNVDLIKKCIAVHTYLNLQLSTAGLFKYVQPFSEHKALIG